MAQNRGDDALLEMQQAFRKGDRNKLAQLLPAARGQGTRRMLYFFAGDGLRIGPQHLGEHAALELVAGQDWALENTGTLAVECLLLQGRPIGEPVAQ